MSNDNVFPMFPTPDHAGDRIHEIYEGGIDVAPRRVTNAETLLGDKPLSFAAPAETIPEHPLAAKLYRDFKAGSQIMTKAEAYKIGNELDSLLAQQLALHRDMGVKIAEARETVANLLATIERLTK